MSAATAATLPTSATASLLPSAATTDSSKGHSR